jgi:hypothetical protein
MNRPIQIADNQWEWFKLLPGDKGVTHDGHKEITEHWLKPDVFDRLTGGVLLPQMGIRRYASEGEAIADLRRASGK